MESAAIIAAVAIAVISLFQIGLALGAPWGAAAYGGNNPGVLPTRLRIISGTAGILVYPFIVVFVLDVGGFVETGLANGGSTKVWLWVLTGLFALGAISNFASRSKIERWWWAPVALVVAVCCGILAAGV
jgi:hypothetical protein